MRRRAARTVGSTPNLPWSLTSTDHLRNPGASVSENLGHAGSAAVELSSNSNGFNLGPMAWLHDPFESSQNGFMIKVMIPPDDVRCERNQIKSRKCRYQPLQNFHCCPAGRSLQFLRNAPGRRDRKIVETPWLWSKLFHWSTRALVMHVGHEIESFPKIGKDPENFGRWALLYNAIYLGWIKNKDSSEFQFHPPFWSSRFTP